MLVYVHVSMCLYNAFTYVMWLYSNVKISLVAIYAI